MPSTAELARRHRRRRWARRALTALGVVVALYAIAFALTYSDRFSRIPPVVWAANDIDGITAAIRNKNVQYVEPNDPRLRQALDARASAGLPAPSERLVAAARRWVAAVNDSNPQAILYHRPDSFGDLYVVFGVWWQTLTPDQQVIALDHLGVAWRRYLRTVFGAWDSREGFAPGIVVVDSQGMAASSINGKVTIYRQPVY